MHASSAAAMQAAAGMAAFQNPMNPSAIGSHGSFYSFLIQ